MIMVMELTVGGLVLVFKDEVSNTFIRGCPESSSFTSMIITIVRRGCHGDYCFF